MLKEYYGVDMIKKQDNGDYQGNININVCYYRYDKLKDNGLKVVNDIVIEINKIKYKDINNITSDNSTKISPLPHL